MPGRGCGRETVDGKGDAPGCPASVLDVLKQLHLMVDIGRLLALNDDRGLEGDEGEQQDGEDDEDQDEDRRQPERRGPAGADRDGPGYSRIMYPAPLMVCSSGVLKPRSILDLRRDIWTSMTLVCGSK